MDTLKMTRDCIYTVKVTDIKHCKKQIHSGPKPTYKHCITIEDGNGKFATCEYLSPDTVVSSDIFEVGAFYRQVKCVQVHEFMNTIEPFNGEVEKEREKVNKILEVSANNVHTIARENTGTLNLSGKSITFATAYAKDILVAEMKNWAQGREVTTADLDRMMGWSEHIARGMAKAVNL